VSPLAIIATQMQLAVALEIIEREVADVPERYAWAARFVVTDRASTIDAMARRIRDKAELKAALAAIRDPRDRTRAARAAKHAAHLVRVARAAELAALPTRDAIAQRIAEEEGHPYEPPDASTVRRWLRKAREAGIL
jgi:hypothetical protein